MKMRRLTRPRSVSTNCCTSVTMVVHSLSGAVLTTPDDHCCSASDCQVARASQHALAITTGHGTHARASDARVWSRSWLYLPVAGLCTAAILTALVSGGFPAVTS